MDSVLAVGFSYTSHDSLLIMVLESKWGLGLDLNLRPKENLNHYSIASPTQRLGFHGPLANMSWIDQLCRQALLHGRHHRLQSRPLSFLPSYLDQVQQVLSNGRLDRPCHLCSRSFGGDTCSHLPMQAGLYHSTSFARRKLTRSGPQIMDTSHPRILSA